MKLVDFLRSLSGFLIILSRSKVWSSFYEACSFSSSKIRIFYEYFLKKNERSSLISVSRIFEENFSPSLYDTKLFFVDYQNIFSQKNGRWMTAVRFISSICFCNFLNLRLFDVSFPSTSSYSQLARIKNKRSIFDQVPESQNYLSITVTKTVVTALNRSLDNFQSEL